MGQVVYNFLAKVHNCIAVIIFAVVIVNVTGEAPPPLVAVLLKGRHRALGKCQLLKYWLALQIQMNAVVGKQTMPFFLVRATDSQCGPVLE